MGGPESHMSPELAAITADPSKLEERLKAWNRRSLREFELARRLQGAPYVLEAIDKAGRTWVVGRFVSMDELVASLKHGTRLAGCGFSACNEDRHDCGEEGYFDGLTEDERDAFMGVL
jgi:hypothetical protein